MPLYKQFKDQEAHILIWKVEESVDELLALFETDTTTLQKECESLFHGEARQKEWLTVRLMISKFIGAGTAICYLSNGQPYLMNSSRKISISHTKDYICIALHQERFLGVDIERVSDRVNHIKSKIMVPAEYSHEALSYSEQTLYNLLIWSMKESAYKCLDIALLDYHNGVLIQPFILDEKGQALACYCQNNYCYYIKMYYLHTDDFVLTWCIE